MKCPKCQFENREGAKFCLECGDKFKLACPECKKILPHAAKFCDECGCNLQPDKTTSAEISEQASADSLSTKKLSSDDAAIVGERKHVTVLFSDLTGYTAMSEKLDPEEVKEITSQIFNEISKIISNYDGFIEKYAGDAVMAMFGVPTAHEDDPVRAIRAAREIHETARRISPEIEGKIGQPLSMHTGITTGLVVTGAVNMKIGTHGAAGDTINSAARLSNLAKPGEILIDINTCRQTEGYFECEYIDTTTVEGKSHPVRIHKVLTQRDKPVTIHRLSGMRSDLIGRKAEMADLSEAVKSLHDGRGSLFSIYGDAGTGKSRLIEEFKTTLDLEQIQWIEAHAYAYSQNIPYFPLIDLLNGLLNIEENDPPEIVKEKVTTGIENLAGNQTDIVPYVGSLYSLDCPEIAEVSPEFWKSSLQSGIKAVLTALAKKAPTIFFLEDLHWADPSFIELLRKSYLEIRQPAIVLCVYRPYFSLFTGTQVSSISKYYHELNLQGLSPSDAQDMMQSLLKSGSIPTDLRRLIQKKAEGNPFYLEELVNTLIETGTLTRDNGDWKITKPISETETPSSIHALITGRLDRLEKETRRILQEASVIGRAFLYEILLKISEITEFLNEGLSTLERMDLIRARAFQPDLEYMFKHPLTQEVVYNGLLKKERQEIHEQVAVVIETVFGNRLMEFYETLAFHYKKGRSVIKAVDYLIRSGEKSLSRFALEESHQYFKEGFDLLSNKPERTKTEEALLIELLNKWSLVYYYNGDFREQSDLLQKHMDLAESINDRSILGMFYAWLGFSLNPRLRLRESYTYLQKALNVGEQIEDHKVIGYACTWLAGTYSELGDLDEAIAYGTRGHEMCQHLSSDQYLYFKSLGGIGLANFYKGHPKKTIEIGNNILDYGRRNSNIRSMFMGHMILGYGHWRHRCFPGAMRELSHSSRLGQAPFYAQGAKVFLGSLYALDEDFQKAAENLHEAATYAENCGCELFLTPAHGCLGLVKMAEGQMGAGLKMIHEALKVCHENERKCVYALLEAALGQVYLKILDKSVPVSLSTMAKNMGFIIKNVPSAFKKATQHFNKALEVADEIGAKGIQGQALLDLGHLHKVKGRTDKARDYFSRAVKIFEKCEAQAFLRQANEALANL